VTPKPGFRTENTLKIGFKGPGEEKKINRSGCTQQCIFDSEAGLDLNLAKKGRANER
jgi:hypothetical protein